MLLVSLCISGLLVVIYHYHRIKRSLPAKQARRAMVQEKLRQFALANRMSEQTTAQIEDFWSQTSETYTLYAKASIKELRNDLYDNAVLLSTTKSQLADSSTTAQQQTQLLKRHADTVQWFSVALVQMDSLFVNPQETPVSFSDVWNELVYQVGQSIRA